MKNKKIKFLTSAACLALIGTASAAWVYSGTATASANIGVKVAPYASAGTITITGNDKLNVVLDNGSVSFVKDNESDTLTAKHNVPSDAITDKTVQKYYSVFISPALYKYITFADGVVSNTVNYNSTDNIGIETTTPYGSLTYENLLYKWTDDTDIFDTLPGLKWQNDQCPDTEEAYKTLINTMVGSDSITTDNWSLKKNSSWTVPSNSDYYVTITFTAIISE